MKQARQSPNNPDWIVFDGSIGMCRCKHCGKILNLSLPQPVEIFANATKAFAKIHAHCPTPSILTEPSPEVIR